MQPPAGAALRALLAALNMQNRRFDCFQQPSRRLRASRKGRHRRPLSHWHRICRLPQLRCCGRRAHLQPSPPPLLQLPAHHPLESRCSRSVGRWPTVTCAANRLEMGCKDHKKACERINRRCDCVSESHSTQTLTDAAFKQTFKREGASEYCARAPGWRHRRATCAADSAAASPSSGTCGSTLIPSAVPAETGAIPAICTPFESRGGTFFLKYILVDHACNTFMYKVV